MVDVDLGFAEQRESAWLTNRYFPSKIGGKPAWLELENLPSSKDLLCETCHEPKSFLCQIYAPFEDEHNFHRAIFIFICRSNDCQKANSAKNFTAYRSQLPRKNLFYSEDPPKEEGNPLQEIPTIKKVCIPCGCLGPLACSRCRKANYCSVKHQRAHWSHHKKLCNSENSNEIEIKEVLPKVRFPEWEIVVEANNSEDESDVDKDDERAETQRWNEYQSLVASGNTGTLKDVPEVELDKYISESDATDDKYFRKFKKEVSKDPEQILRYKRGGSPLWISDVEQTIGKNVIIPKCELCASERQFEFQIMPQMLNLLKDDSLDWGTIAVYTCKKSCDIPIGKGYVSEYILKQDIVANENTK